MINGKTVLAIIPARLGSKGLPGKNIRDLCGKPLIAWTIENAKKSRYLDKVLVTTNCPDIVRISLEYGAEAPFIRPDELASDHASTYDVINHTLAYFRDTENKEFDYTVLLEPTSPLREKNDIDQMLEILESHEHDYDAIVSVGEVNEHPSIMKRLVNGKIESYYKELPQTLRRQDNPSAYFPYGVAYIAKTATLLEENTFYARRCTYFVTKRYQNYEIDDLYDFCCVESVMKLEWGLE